MGYRPKSDRAVPAAGDQTAENGFAHVAAADKTDFFSITSVSLLLSVLSYSLTWKGLQG
jgi:hypothetical protein